MVVLRPGGRASAVFLLVLLTACSGDQTPTDRTGDVSVEPAPGAEDLVISGSVGDGPATGADIVITDGHGEVVAETTSDSEAGYRVTLPPDTVLPVTVRATGGHDLVTGRPLDFDLVGAAVEAGTQHVNLAPLPTLALLAAECTAAGVTAAALSDARDRVGASLAMGLDGALVTDPLTDPVTPENVEAVVLANEALGEVVRRTVQALSSTGSSTTADEVMQAVACDLVGADASDAPLRRRIMVVFKAAELLVRLETLAGRLEVDGTSAAARMDDAIRLVMPGFLNPSVATIPVNERARGQALDVLVLLQTVADNDALAALATAISGATTAEIRGLVDSALDASLHGDLYGLPERLALAGDSVVTELDQRRARQPDVRRPTLALAADPATVTGGGSTTLSWASENADVCVAGGGWSGPVALEGVHVTPVLEATTVFELSCVGLGGAAKRAVSVTVEDANEPEPEPQPQPDPEPDPEPAPDPEPVVPRHTTATSVSSPGEPSLDALAPFDYDGETLYTWTPAAGFDQPAAGRLEITFVAPPRQTRNIALIWRGRDQWGPGTFSVWLWDGELHARFGSAGIFRPEGVHLVDGQEHTATFSWNSTTGQFLILVDGEIKVFHPEWNVGLPGMTALPEPAYGGWNPNLDGYAGRASFAVYDSPATVDVDPCAPIGTLDYQAIPAPDSCSPAEPEPQPTLTLASSDATVGSGDSTELSWSSQDATSCSASGGWSGARATSGSETVGPLSADTTFRLTCTGPGGSVSESVAVSVEPVPEPEPEPEPEPAPEPTVDLSASAAVVDSGDPVQLTWSSEHADGCRADGGWSGGRTTSGSESVGPLTRRTTFSLTCSGDGGNAMSMISVAVNGSVVLQWEPPTENVDGSPLTDLAGYRIYYGSSSGDYGDVLSISAAGTAHSITLESGTYYFAMTALDIDGNESAYSNEVTKTVD